MSAKQIADAALEAESKGLQESMSEYLQQLALAIFKRPMTIIIQYHAFFYRVGCDEHPLVIPS